MGQLSGILTEPLNPREVFRLLAGFNEIYSFRKNQLFITECRFSSPPPVFISFTNIIKQEIYIHVAYSRPNGWTDWAELFCGHSWVARGFHRLKNSMIFFLLNFIIFFPRAKSCPSGSRL